MREQGKSKAEMTSPGRALWLPGSPMLQHSLSQRVLEGKTADRPTASPRGPGHALELGGTTWERSILQPRHPSAITPIFRGSGGALAVARTSPAAPPTAPGLSQQTEEPWSAPGVPQ